MRSRGWAFGMVSVSLSGVCAGQTAPAGCASTPAGAIQAARLGRTETQTIGYRVEAMRWDVAQRQTWAVIRSCDHAERPALALLADLPHGPAAALGTPAALAASAVQTESATVSVSSQIVRANAAVAVVHAGEVVRLWRADSQAHIELMATAEENGVVGAKVRLRLMTPKEPDGQYAPPQYLAGIVRGPADVEMER